MSIRILSAPTVSKVLSKRSNTVKKTVYNGCEFSQRRGTIKHEFCTLSTAMYNLEKTPYEMTTVYFSSNIKDKTDILNVPHANMISMQVIKPIKRSKDPIPSDEIHYKIQGASYDVFNLLYLLGKKKAKIKFLY